MAALPGLLVLSFLVFPMAPSAFLTRTLHPDRSPSQ